MATKLFILFIMFVIIGSLFSGLFFLVKDTTSSKRMVKALTLRISISLILFVFLILAFKLGWITPHAI